MNIFLASVLFSVHLTCVAAQDIPVDAARELTATHKAFITRSFAVGRLRDTEQNDVVAAIREEDASGEAQHDRVLSDRSLSYRIVLLEEGDDQNGKYTLACETKQLGELRGLHEFHVAIKKKSLFLHTSDKTGYSDWQFKMIKGGLHLIGIERVESPAESESRSVTIEKSINFLTGVRQTRITNITNGKRSVSKTISNRFSRKPVPLKDFELEYGLSEVIDG